MGAAEAESPASRRSIRTNFAISRWRSSKTANLPVTGLQAYQALEVIESVYLSEVRRQPISLPMSAADRAEADRLSRGEATRPSP